MTAMIHRDKARDPLVKARVVFGGDYWLWWCRECRLDGIYSTHVDAITAATAHIRDFHRTERQQNVVPFEVAFETLTREQAAAELATLNATLASLPDEEDIARIRRRVAELAWLIEHDREEQP